MARRFLPLLGALLLLLSLVAAPAPRGGRTDAAAQQSIIQLPPGYTIEKVVDGLTYATALTWDDQGQLYVAEAGGQFLEEPPPARILRVEPGRATPVVTLTEAQGVADSIIGLTWHRGAFYFTHRDPVDRTGAVSRVTLDGTVTRLFSGLLDSQSEHQVGDIKVGPDGRMYIGTGPAFNSAVAGPDVAAFVSRSAGVKTTPCQDIVLTGQNFQTPDFRTPDPSDTALTGAYVPFGTPTTPGQVIPGTNKCGGAILVFDPENAEATLDVYAWGFRNIIGLGWNARGELFAGVNGYDNRGSRPVNDEYDATYKVVEGGWYGWPDFSAALEPLTDPKFDAPDQLQASVFVGGVLQPKGLGFVIDHAASGLRVADRSQAFGLHDFNSSPSMLDFAPAAWGELAGHLFVAEYGDLAPNTNPLLDKPAGYQIVRIDPAGGRAAPFVSNQMPGPASAQNAMGRGLERPVDVKFGPDGAMYISDYGVSRVNPARAAEGQVPYEFPPNTGAIWKVTRTGTVGAAIGAAPARATAPAVAAVAPQAQRAAATGNGTRTALLRSVAGAEVGTARFTRQSGAVLLHAEVRGLPPGFHGFHIHTVGVCDPATAFESAGGHLNAGGQQHDDHAGDLPSLYVNADGTGMLSILTDRFTVAALIAGDGSTLIVHADADNFAHIPPRYAPALDAMTLATGDSGGRIACGVIRSTG